MISIDSKNLHTSPLDSLKKLSQKKEGRKTKFLHNEKAQESSSFGGVKEIADIAPMLFLQEISDNASEDRQNLAAFGKRALASLKQLQFALINQELTEKHLYDLRDALARHKLPISNPELENIASEIELRVEVEIAKLEQKAEFEAV